MFNPLSRMLNGSVLTGETKYIIRPNILINYVPSETVSVAPIIDKFSTTSSDHNSINDSAIIYEEINDLDSVCFC